MSRGSSAVLALAACAATTAIAGCSDDPVPVPALVAADPAAIARGAALFRDPALSTQPFNAFACATCHEAEAEAAPVTRPGAPLAGVLERPWYWGGEELDLLRAVNHCRYYFMLDDEPWTGDEPLASDLYAYLASLPPTLPDPVPFTIVVDVGDPPQGDAPEGEAVYTAACATCHGQLHTGFGRPTLLVPVLPDGVYDDHALGEATPLERRLVFARKVRHGRFLGYGGQMPPFSIEALSDEEVGDLLAHLGL